MPRAVVERVLVIYDAPQAVGALLESSFPDTAFAYATNPAAVEPALSTGNPQAVLSLKHAGFPGEAHRPAVLHPSVRWFHVGGSGYEHVRPWDPRRVTVTNCAGVLARDLAETVTGAMLALNGNFLRYIEQQRQKSWQGRAFRPLHGQTLLIVGLGAIGSVVAANAKALGMRVLALRRSAAPHPAVDECLPMEALPAIIGQADFVSLHVRSTDETRGLMSATLLQAMKPGAILINTSRGAVLDEAALVALLRSGHLGGAYLDVFATEPLPQMSPLWQLPNVLLTPHAADNVADWPVRYAEVFAQNLRRWRSGRPLLNEVRP
ncbi:MAG: D-2-hydroxyacid dehydrogenase [Alphaproteobacteria bacterium]